MAILIPLFDDDEQALREHLEEQVLEDKDGDTGEFLSALDLDVSHIDSRATVHEVEIEHVEILDDGLHVAYLVHYSIYNGCKDMNVVDYEELSVYGQRTAEGWAFEEHVPLPRRSTFDEF